LLFISIPDQGNAGVAFLNTSCCISEPGCIEFGPDDVVGCIAGTLIEDGMCTELGFEGQCVPRANEVPTLNEWGLIALVALLGIIGFIVIRRRKAAA